MTDFRLRIFTEPQQGARYADLLRVATIAEAAGYDAFFRSDHLMRIGPGDGRPGPTDSWVTLGALATQTRTIRLGTLVTAATFRHPGPLAVAVAQVDDMSGGRVEFGIGTGWYEQEHAAYGVPFPGLGERFDRLTEQLEIVTGLWSTPENETFSFAGKHYQLVDSPALPKPVQRQGPPVIIGGGGRRRTPALAARFAAEFNVGFQTVEVAVEQVTRVADAVRAAGREPGSMTYSVAQTIAVGRDDAEVARRAEAIGMTADQVRTNGLAGTPDEVVDKLGAFRERAGISRAYLQLFDLSDVDQIELIAERVAPQLG